MQREVYIDVCIGPLQKLAIPRGSSPTVKWLYPDIILFEQMLPRQNKTKQKYNNVEKEKRRNKEKAVVFKLFYARKLLGEGNSACQRTLVKG